MPIYAYRCTTCGHTQDVLQKMSDAVLAVCPACGAATYAKQVTAAGFQLKGSGWYVTDFRGGNNSAGKKDDKAEGDGADAKPDANTDAKPDVKADATVDPKAAARTDGKPADGKAADGKPAGGKPAADKAASAPAPAPAAAPAPGTPSSGS